NEIRHVKRIAIRSQLIASLVLDQQAKWGKRADRQQFVAHDTVSHERQRIERCLGLLDRFAGYQKDRAGFLTKPELLDLAVEIELECGRDLVWHVLLKLLGREGRLGGCD